MPLDKTLEKNYDVEGFNNPFGGRAGKFVALNKEDVEQAFNTTSQLSIDDLNKATNQKNIWNKHLHSIKIKF